MAGQGYRARGLVGGGVRAINHITDILYYPYHTHCFKVSSRYSIGLPCYGLHKKSLRNLSKGLIAKK